MGLNNCEGLCSWHNHLAGASSSQVSTNLRRLGDSESDMPRPQCGGTPTPPPRSGSQVSAAGTLRAVDQTHPHLSM